MRSASNPVDPVEAVKQVDSAQTVDERMHVPWWWYLAGALIAAVLAGQFRLALYSLPLWIPFAVLVPVSLLLTWRVGSARLRVDSEGLHMRHAHLPLDAVGDVVELDARTLRLLAGRRGDPAAYSMLLPWIGPGLQVMVDDPDDPTPYWLFSTRRPHHVATVLRARTKG